MKAVGVHGFRLNDGGAATVGRIDPYLRDYGFEVDSDGGDYGYFGLFDIRWRNGERRRQVLYRLARAFEDVQLVYDHSNGGHFTNTAMRMLPPDFQDQIVVVNISPAMNRKTEPTYATKAELNLCTPHDGWVRLSRLLPFEHPWGSRGARGYCGESPKVTNEFHSQVENHSDWFLPEHIGMTVQSTLDFWEEHK